MLVVFLFLRQVFLDLLDVRADIGRRREHGSDAERNKIGVDELPAVLYCVEKRIVLDGVVDAGSGEQRVEPASASGGVVLGEDGIDDGTFGERPIRFDLRTVGLVVIDVETQDVAVFDGVGDGVGVQFLLEEVLRGSKCLDIAFDALVAGILFEDGRAGEAEELSPREELFDGLVIVAKLRTVALVENKNHSLVAEWFEEVRVGRQALLFPALVSLTVLVKHRPSF